MNGLFRLAGLLLILGVLALAAPGMTAADTDTGLGLRISAEKAEFGPGEPIRLTFTVVNKSSAACDLATTETGTVRVISLRRDGQTLRPAMARSYFLDGIQNDIAASLLATEPGSAVPVAVTGFRLHDGDAADSLVISSVSAMPGGGGVDALWPVGEPGRYELTATYAIPEVDGRPCTGSATAATVAFTVGEEDGGLPAWVLAAGVALVMLVLGGLAAVLVRRRAGRGEAGAVVVLTVVAGMVGGPSPRADADLEFPETGTFGGQVQGCMDRFQAAAAGSSPAARSIAALFGRLNSTSSPIRIVRGTGESRTIPTRTNDGKVSVTVRWNPTRNVRYVNDVMSDPCAELYHELVHADDNAQGRWEDGDCLGFGIPKAEVKATLEENVYRSTQESLRKFPRKRYNGMDLPNSMVECSPHWPPRNPKKGPGWACADGCAGSYGDPHLVTFDQLRYDFQAVGEFVLTRGDGLEVQARQAPFGGWTPGTVSVNAALAFQVGETRLNLVLVDGDIAVRIDGAAVDTERGERPLPGGGALVRQESSSGFGPDTYVVRWPDGSAVHVDTIGTWGLRPVLELDRVRIGAVEGLLGDFNGDPADDLTPAGGGTPLGTEPEFEPLYRTFGESWRVRDDTSLFDYAPGEGTATFTDRSFPEKKVTVDDLDPAQRTEAEWICRAAGVTEPAVLDDCVLDVAVTGQPDFAVASADTELVAPPVRSITAPTLAKETLVVDLAGGTDRLTFTGEAGQEVFIDLGAATLPDQCGTVRLLDPSGSQLSRGCVIDGGGTIDRAELPSDGQYTVELEPDEQATGSVLVRVYEVVDDTGSITPDGQAETVALTHPGSVGRLTFTGRAGQTVFVNAPRSSLPSLCGVLQLLGPDGERVENGCVITGEGYVDATTLPADGRYIVQVDPPDELVGDTELRLTVVQNQSGSITVDGPSVRATVRQPGGTSGFEFRGRAGQRIGVDASESTLPGECGVVVLVGPGDEQVRTGCVIHGVGGIDELSLPTDGVYRVVIDPQGHHTGAVTLRLTG